MRKTDLASAPIKTSLASPDASSTKSQKTIELTLTSADITKAEIRWALDSVLKGNSNNRDGLFLFYSSKPLKYPRARVMPKFYDLSIYLYLFTE